MHKRHLLPIALLPLALFIASALSKPNKRPSIEPLISFDVWGDPGELSEEDMHGIASTVTILISNSIQDEDQPSTSLPLGIEKNAVEEVMLLINSHS